METGGRLLVAVAYDIARLRLRLESFVTAMIANAGKKPMATNAPLFTRFQTNRIIETHRTTIVLDVIFALLLTFVVVLSFAAVYTVDYSVQTAASVVTMPLVVLVLIFQSGVVSGPIAGAVER